MTHLLKVRIGRIVCRNTESLSEYDNFALSGAVIVDGTVTPFDRDPVAVNERIAATYENPTIFDGFSESLEVGLVLRGYDIDNNDKWVANRERIGEASEKIAEVVEYVPIIGEYAAMILEKWPDVVDVFVDLDENDLLLSHAQAVTLPAVSALKEGMSHHAVTIRFMRRDPFGYSDWDYSLPIHFDYRNLDVPSLGHVAAESTRPRAGSAASEWLGTWQSGSVSAHVAAADGGGLDVSVSETIDGVTSQVQTKGVEISRVYLEQIVTPVDEGAPFTRVVVERPAGSRARVVEPFDPATLSTGPSFRGASLGSRGSGGIGDQSTTVAGVARGSSSSAVGSIDSGPVASGVEGVADRGGLDVTGPLTHREQSGADLLQLNGDAVLEIYEILLDKKPSDGRQLRYVRPVSNTARSTSASFDEMLKTRLV